jgi:hypothetical protein
MPIFEEWRFPEEVSCELGKLRAKVAEARNKLESEKNLVEKRPPTYIQSRAMKTIDHHDKQLLSLDDEFSDKKGKLEEKKEKIKTDKLHTETEYKSKIQKLEKALETLYNEYDGRIKALEKSIEDIDTEKKKKKEYHEAVIERAKGEMDYKPPTLIRAEEFLEKAIVARDKFLESAIQNTSAHLVIPSTPIELPPYSRPPRPIIPPVDDGKVYYDPEGNICSKGEYEIRQRRIEREEKHTRLQIGETCGDPMCVSCQPLPKPKKFPKTAEKR